MTGQHVDLSHDATMLAAWVLGAIDYRIAIAIWTEVLAAITAIPAAPAPAPPEPSAGTRNGRQLGTSFRDIGRT
jgi:hypothetical protein